MLLSHCPNCQHNNKPGEQFCASCGVPLNLKPCPVCGRVDDLKVTICTGCGAHFELFVPDPYADVADLPDLGAETVIPSLVPPPSSTMRPLPLIVVALVAAGIPLLWMYRNEMPVPKAWQPQQDVSVEAPAIPAEPVAPPSAPTSKPKALPTAPPTAPEPPHPAPPPFAPLPPATTIPVVPAIKTVDDTQPPAAVSEPPAASKPPHAVEPVSKAEVALPQSAPPAARPVAKPVVRSNFPTKQTPPPAAAPGSDCTEALAAVGLCDPKAGR
jgi:hypothetical protein